MARRPRTHLARPGPRAHAPSPVPQSSFNEHSEQSTWSFIRERSGLLEHRVTHELETVPLKSSRNRAALDRKQPTPQELRDELLGFLQRKFYPGQPVAFAKDRRRLLDWVILWPAKWLDDRGVTIPADRYRAIFMSVFMDGLRFGDTANITYLPAWLAKCIQSHFPTPSASSPKPPASCAPKNVPKNPPLKPS